MIPFNYPNIYSMNTPLRLWIPAGGIFFIGVVGLALSAGCYAYMVYNIFTVPNPRTDPPNRPIDVFAVWSVLLLLAIATGGGLVLVGRKVMSGNPIARWIALFIVICVAAMGFYLLREAVFELGFRRFLAEAIGLATLALMLIAWGIYSLILLIKALTSSSGISPLRKV